jgi:glycoprotein 3-alpha-L-fucosyltransferase
MHVKKKVFTLIDMFLFSSDYITEKFWRSLSYDIVPVVLQPTRDYYEKRAPPNSFIHAGDFDYDMARLAEYLTKVAHDLKLYSSYLEWKRSYRSLFKAADVDKLRLCELCANLNTHDKKEPVFDGYYENYAEWFNGQCKR